MNAKKYFKSMGASLTVLAIIGVAIIYFWPHKTGDVRVNEQGVKEVYWRGPDMADDGRWLPIDNSVDKQVIINYFGAMSGKLVIDGKRVIDCVPIGRGQCVIVFDNGKAIIARLE